uniref:Uncharacterized protein n=3 Tax=Aegilops tauschii subsp. strangulata TaxID=200361 RepID=A0A453I2L4_AEGTS
MAACVGDLRASLVGGHRGARDVGEGGSVQTPSHISPELISIGDQVRVKNRLLPSLSTTLGVNRTTASRCLRVPYPPEL